MNKNISKKEIRIKVLQKKNAALKKKIIASYESQLKQNKKEIATLKEEIKRDPKKPK